MRFAPSTLLLLVILVSGACSMAPLDQGGAKIVVIDRPYEACEYVATAYGRSFFEENAMNNLRNKVAEAGATHLVVTAETRVGGPIQIGRASCRERVKGWDEGQCDKK